MSVTTRVGPQPTCAPEFGETSLVIDIAAVFRLRPAPERWVVRTEGRDHNSPIDYYASAPANAATDRQPVKPNKEKT